ncbi:uncharacterized protein LOC120347529 isoform X1 [Styela clava]
MDNIYTFFLVISVSCNYLNEAATCTDCGNITLGKESKNITYGSSNEYNCNCEWTIPTSMYTDHGTAVVLLLQNVSLPMTTGTGSIDCPGEIRFPTTTPIATTILKLHSSTQTSPEETSKAGRDETSEIPNGITPRRQGQGSNDTSTPLTTNAESDSTTVIIIVVCITVLLVIGIAILLILRYCKSKKTTPEEPIKLTEIKGSNRSSEKVMVDNILYGTADANSVPENKEVNGNDDTDVAALYSVVQKNKTEPDGNRIVIENKDTVTVQEDPSCVYAVVQK